MGMWGLYVELVLIKLIGTGTRQVLNSECLNTVPDGAVVKLSANGLVGTGFASRYRSNQELAFKGPLSRRKATTPSSLSLTSKRVTTNY